MPPDAKAKLTAMAKSVNTLAGGLRMEDKLIWMQVIFMNMLGSKQKGILLALLSTLPLGMSAVFFKCMLEYINLETGNLLWFIFQSISFIFVSAIFKRIKAYEEILKNFKDLFLFAFITFLAVLTWSYGIFYDGPIVTGFLLRFSDVFAILFGFLIIRERPSKVEALGIFLAVFGALYMGYSGTSGFTLFPIVSALFHGVAALFVKVYARKIDYFYLMGGRSTYVLLFVIPYTFFSRRMQITFSAIVFLHAFLGASIGAFLGWLLFYKSLSLVDLSIATACKAFNPFVTVLLSIVVLSAMPTINQMVGGGLIALGITIIGFKQKV